MANKWTREKIKIPSTLKPKERIQLAEVILNQITTRTLNGLDKNNNKFKKYTKGYAESKGVGVNDVDLVLSGEMIESLELVSHKPGELVIGYKDPSEELAGKVEGNRRGSYGRDPDPKKARDFLGIESDELEILIDAYTLEEEVSGGTLSQDELDALSEELAEELFS